MEDKMDLISVERKGPIAVVTIDHPPANTWNLATTEAFEEVVAALETDGDVRVVVITGSGEKYFSAGFDVKDAANSPKISPKARALWTRIDRFPKPVIAAINGYAMGGGLELALACHFRIMADAPKAIVGLSELNLGIIPGWGGTQRLTQVVGKAKALDLILFSKTLSPAEALEIGLVNRVVAPERLMEATLAFADNLSQRPPIAVSCVLKAISAGIYEGLEQGLRVEEEGSYIVRASEDCKEGFTAFIEKRPPVFSGK
jgi:enoyl-CoA hydratase/carnithine racemase